MLRNLVRTFFVGFVCAGTLFAQNLNEPPKQTARQALIEMFLGKGPDDFVKHLPEKARGALIHKGDTPEGSWALRLAEIGRTIGAQGQHVETFDTGPTILVMADREGHEKLEISVEHDSLMGESDEIELSIKYFRDGQEIALPVVPRFIFALQEEKEIWRLTEVTAAAHMPLTDPDYLKNLRKLQNQSNEVMIQMRVNAIVGAENAYAATHPDRGYACNLSTLFGQEKIAQAEVQRQLSGEDTGEAQPALAANFFDPGQQNEVWNGYRFTLSACEGSPASKYLLIAAPAEPEPDTEMKTFCADESGVVKFSTSGKSSSCTNSGQPLSQGTPPAPAD